MRTGALALLITACSNAPGTGPAATPDAAPQQQPDAAKPVSNVTVSLTFDDTLADQYQVGAMLASHDMHATFFINSSRVGLSGYMTLAQVRDLAAAGNEIAGHTLTHPYLTQLTPDQARSEICDDRNALVTMGFQPTSFAYPFGDSNATVEQITSDCGYTIARTIGGLESQDCSSCPYVNSMPPSDRFAVRTPGSVAAGTTFTQLTDYITQAEQHGGGWIPLVFHHVCEACNPNQIQPAVLEKLLVWLDDHGVTVKTVGEMP